MTLKSISGGSKAKRTGMHDVVLCNVDARHSLPIVFSPARGCYVWLDGSASSGDIDYNSDDRNNFSALRSAYMQFEEEGFLTDEMRKDIFWEVIKLFHMNFSFVSRYDSNKFDDEYPFFSECVLKLVNRYNIPPLVKADLCRHARMFRKCLDYVGHVKTPDEVLMLEEVCIRAARGDRFPIDYETVCRYLSPSMSETSPFVYWFYNGFLY